MANETEVGMEWDVEDAVEYLQANAAASSVGRCAAYTRRAIETFVELLKFLYFCSFKTTLRQGIRHAMQQYF